MNQSGITSNDRFFSAFDWGNECTQTDGNKSDAENSDIRNKTKDYYTLYKMERKNDFWEK